MNPFLLVIVGPFAAGKTTIANGLTQSLKFKKSVTMTTRSPRPGEVDGVDYFFTTREKFVELEKSGEFIETATINEHFYGTRLATINDALKKGDHLILTIDIQGYESLLRSEDDRIKQALRSIFVTAPLEDLVARAINRPGGMADEELGRRTRRSLSEIKRARKLNFNKTLQNLDGEFDDNIALLTHLVQRWLIDMETVR
ncbi:MAG: Guanylate kinase [Candidatus Parcubacteria bacterium]|jgi:guanylate kinase